MNREQLEIMLVDYVYNELDEQTRVQFETAVLEWPDLAAEVSAHQQTRRMMQSVPELDPPATFTMDVVRAARLENAKPEKQGFWARLTALMMQPSFAVATVFVAVASVGSFLATEAEQRGERLEDARSAAAVGHPSPKPASSSVASGIQPSVPAKTSEPVASPALADRSSRGGLAAGASAKEQLAVAPPPMKAQAPPKLAQVKKSRYAAQRPKSKAKRVLDSKVTNWRFAATGTRGEKLSGIESSKLGGPSKTKLQIASKVRSAAPASKRLAGSMPVQAGKNQIATPDGDTLLRAYRAHKKAKRWNLAGAVLAKMNRLPKWRQLVAKERKLLQALAKASAENKAGVARSKKSKRTKLKAAPASNPSK